MRLLINRDGIAVPQTHEVSPDSTVAELAATFFGSSEVYVWADSSPDRSIDPSLTLSNAGLVDHAEVSITHRSQVTVTVRFNGAEHNRTFRPQARMREVFDWAVGPKAFNLASSQRPDHELTPTGDSRAVRPRLPVAAYADPSRNAQFDLRRKSTYQG